MNAAPSSGKRRHHLGAETSMSVGLLATVAWRKGSALSRKHLQEAFRNLDQGISVAKLWIAVAGFRKFQKRLRVLHARWRHQLVFTRVGGRPNDATSVHHRADS